MSVGAPVVIEARDVHKSFRLPGRDELRALRGVSFAVARGEFFGVVGRNGSGKSTLLKILASIYGPDSGRIRMAGRLAPFIELGVGFNVELTARENVALNGVMMGLGRREASRRLEAVLEFAELERFVDLRLKNYSSGMLVRLAFAVMVEADADIMLIDEVLAVGDASFAQKCLDVFRAKRAAGRTLVLVTHDMATVQGFCDRAMLLDAGEVRYLGEPEEAALRYYRLNFTGGDDGADAERHGAVELVDAWLQDAHGERVERIARGEPLGIQVVVRTHHELEAPLFAFQVHNAAGVPVFGFGRAVREDRVPAGRRVRVGGRVDNPLLPGRHTVSCTVARDRTAADVVLRLPELLDFEVHEGDRPPASIHDFDVGLVSVRRDVRATVEP